MYVGMHACDQRPMTRRMQGNGSNRVEDASAASGKIFVWNQCNYVADT